MVVYQTKAFIETCGTCPIGMTAVCARCDPGEISALEELKFYKRITAGQNIIRAGDKMDYVASLVSGMATLTHTLEDGRQQVMGLLHASDFLGRPGRTTAVFDVVAITDVLMCCFRRKPFEALLVSMPHVRERLLEMALDELDAAREWMLLLGRKTAREKVATLLVLIGRRMMTRSKEPNPNDMAFKLPLTRIQMADYLGLTEETVSRQISDLKRDGVIVLSGRTTVQVRDFRRLLEESGDDSDGAVIA